MTLIITVIHILVSLSLIFVVLLQRGSGADMGAAFGGSSQNLFGARGSGSFLGKMTAGLATVFMITSLSLAFFTNQSPTTSVMDQKVAKPVDNGSPAVVDQAASESKPAVTQVETKSGEPPSSADAVPQSAHKLGEQAKPIPAAPSMPKGDAIPLVPKSGK
ncbi:MAG: preprotein translocase subunit SecG [Magnetococcus sp. DMHC-6]